MCCFSRPIKRVADTNIFARAAERGRQYVVYSMTFSAAEDLAMILPLPTPKGVKEDAVKFINLEKYVDFFADLTSGFPEPPTRSAPEVDGQKKLGGAPKLKVIDVGTFEASFVPTQPDFARLDDRFRLPPSVWEKLPQYRDWSFAVFKLKKDAKDGQKAHPMAFEFPRADAKKLFFPTVHIHDGKVHATARFDHALFCQVGPEAELSMFEWEESPQHAVQFMKTERTQGIVLGDAHCYRRRMRGVFKNADVLV
jgi:hypothetical protein